MNVNLDLVNIVLGMMLCYKISLNFLSNCIVILYGDGNLTKKNMFFRVFID
ncbi:hypothetical protein LDP10_01060 [Buchnera aphidicola (Pemphigus obesinymphae)]|uniref:hypothetical protein n=1 Tax=Buchnera aphidicola TaxID=9 RepID=UPI002238FD09|nr:hypothetical protein [Buchnera aphidicola]MCW5196540.1 hypothetical protein [Buchnera aphidicola (Pemphigus obesinymphae)]